MNNHLNILITLFPLKKNYCRYMIVTELQIYHIFSVFVNQIDASVQLLILVTIDNMHNIVKIIQIDSFYLFKH